VPPGVALDVLQTHVGPAAGIPRHDALTAEPGYRAEGGSHPAIRRYGLDHLIAPRRFPIVAFIPVGAPCGPPVRTALDRYGSPSSVGKRFANGCDGPKALTSGSFASAYRAVSYRTLARVLSI